jgi:hypothetical protein
MDWIRENKTLAGILGVIIAGVLALGYLLYDAWNSYTAAKDAYITLGSEVARVQGAALAPTEKNLSEKKALVEGYGQKVNQLGTALQFLQPVAAPTTDAEFQKKLLDRISKAKAMAEALKVKLPAEFAFGFGEYLGSFPKAELSTELSGYLDGVEMLTKLAMTSKVTSIDLLDRSQLPTEKAGAPASATPKKSPYGQQAAAAPTAKAIYEKNQVTMVLTLDQGSLQTLLSRLANTSDTTSEADSKKSFFSTVRLVRVENQAKTGPRKTSATPAPAPEPQVPEAPAPAPAKDGKEAAPAGPVEIKPPAPSAPDSFAVLGQEMLKVYLEIDLVKFLPAAPAAAPRQ